MQGFEATELLMNSHENDDLRSAKIEREAVDSLLIESVFHNKKPECVAFAEASKLILCYNFESPDRASAFLYGELGKTPLEFVFHDKKPGCVTSKLILLCYNVESPDRASAFLLQNDDRTENKVLALDVAEYVHYNAETVDLISSQDMLSMLLKKTSVSHSANQHKCPACSQGREIFSGSCNALPIVTDGDTVTERTLWLIKQRARLCQKNKMGITFLVMITMLGSIPGVKAAEKNASALVQGSTTTSTVVCVIIGTVASLYFSYKILEWFMLPPPVFPEPDWILFSRKVRIRTEGYMESAKMHLELFDAEDKRVGSWECSFVIEGGDIVDMVSWGTHLFNMMLHIFVEQEGGEQEISFNEMDHPDFINKAKDVYFHNPDTGLLHFIGISPPRNDLPGEREILRRRIWHAHADATRW